MDKIFEKRGRWCFFDRDGKLVKRESYKEAQTAYYEIFPNREEGTLEEALKGMEGYRES